MEKNVIHIYGASGSGTSTLGKYISEQMGYTFMDTDDYYWLPSDPQYTKKREINERILLMEKDIFQSDQVVISGSLVDWGNELIPYFTLAVRVAIGGKVRLERLKERERQCFGSRIEAGGDMYRNHLEFMEWAAGYDTGDLNTRSKAKHDQWQTLLKCRQIVVNGEDPLVQNLELIKKSLLT